MTSTFLGPKLPAMIFKTEKNVEIVNDEQNMIIEDDLVIKQV